MKIERLSFIILLCAAALLASPAPAFAWGRSRQERKETHLQKGRAALQDGFFDIAQKEFEKYLDLASTDGERAEGALLLARTLFWKGRFDEAAEFLRKREPWAVGTTFEPDFLLLRARVEFERAELGAALLLAQDFGRRFPVHPLAADAARLRAKCHLRAGEYEPAVRILSGFEAAYPASIEVPDSLLDWSAALLALKRSDEAIPVLERLVGAFPATDAAAQGRLWLGRLQADRLRFAAARETLTQVATQQNARIDRRADAWFALAAVEEACTNQAAAVAALDEVARLTADRAMRARAGAWKGTVLVRMGKPDEGVMAVREAIALMSPADAAGAQLDLADALLDTGRFETAAREFQNFLDAFADQDGAGAAVMGRGWSLWGLERHAEAAMAFDKAAGLFADRERQAEAVFKAGDAFLASGQPGLAMERYHRVATEFPASELAARARFQKAESLALMNDPAGAEAEFTALAAAQPGTALALEAQLRVARLKEGAGQWEQSLAIYDKVAGSCTNSLVCARALHGASLIRYRIGQFKDARAGFERVVSEYPNSEFAEQAFYMRGWCLYLLGNAEEALAVCRRFIEKHPESPWAPDVLFWLGEYYFNLGDYAQAERQFADLATRYPQGVLAPDALFWAGRAASAQKEFLRAIEHFSALAKNYPGSSKGAEARFAQGDALSELGNYPAAILAFEEVIVKYPSSPLVDLAWGRKGDCQFTLGKDDTKRYQEALASYRMVLDSPRADRDLKWQAEYKIGRCREKMGLPEEAVERYMNVVYGYLSDMERGTAGDPLWFTRAAFGAAAIRESQEKWREAVGVYRRVAEAAVPASAEAEERIRKIRSEHWVLF